MRGIRHFDLGDERAEHFTVKRRFILLYPVICLLDATKIAMLRQSHDLLLAHGFERIVLSLQTLEFVIERALFKLRLTKRLVGASDFVMNRLRASSQLRSLLINIPRHFGHIIKLCLEQSDRILALL